MQRLKRHTHRITHRQQTPSEAKMVRLSSSAIKTSMYLADEVSGSRADRNLSRKPQVHSENALVCVGVPLSLKGRLAEQELVA